ncbi:MAG: hypothetical protein K8S87_02295 [Planctomycetes bacterium]|nr:hypothetical protein [Planctomycetota bacterium]
MSQKKADFPLKCLRENYNRKVRVIIADDKDRYLNHWRAVLDSDIFELKFGYNANEILDAFDGDASAFDVLISDISMHTEDEKGILGNMQGEFAGVSLSMKLRKMGFTGDIALVSTGIDDFIGQILCHFIMGFFGVDWLVPKRTLVKGNPVFLRRRLFWK